MNRINSVIQYFRAKPLDCVLFLLFALAIIKLYSLYSSANTDAANWETFKVENNCQLVKTDYGNKKLRWKCADGEVYYRWMQQQR